MEAPTFEAGFFAAGGGSSNAAATLDARVSIDADGFGGNGSVVIATLGDAFSPARDFIP